MFGVFFRLSPVNMHWYLCKDEKEIEQRAIELLKESEDDNITAFYYDHVNQEFHDLNFEWENYTNNFEKEGAEKENVWSFLCIKSGMFF